MKKKIAFLITFLLLIALFSYPVTSQTAAKTGLFLCGKVIIPSLFPFTVCVLFLIKCGVFSALKPLRPFARLFHLSLEPFTVLLFSAVGGYPIGAKLLRESVREKQISGENASLMLCYCVNAGPAFILLTVGRGLFASAPVGKILLGSHLAVSLLLAFFGGFFLKKESAPPVDSDTLSLPDCFVSAVNEASKAVLLICSCVIFFSVVTAVCDRAAASVPVFTQVSSLLEITCGLSKTRNLFFASFLLGFAGLSVWCQVFSLAEDIPIRFGLFLVFRILHGSLSAIFTFLLLCLFPVSLTASARPTAALVSDSISLSLALLMMAILFLLSLLERPVTP